MKFILPNCRQRFTPADLRFISRVVAPDPRQEQALFDLLRDGDTDARDHALDEERLFQAIQDAPGCSEVSEHCYFFVLVRHVLRRVGITDRRVADYVAELLAGYLDSAASAGPRDAAGRSLESVFELVGAMRSADERTRFYIQAHLGNQTLFLTGMFPARIRHQTNRRGAPGIAYYEGMGRSGFKAASDHRLAERYELDRLLAELAEAFGEVRHALNDLAERVAFVGDGPTLN